MLVANCAMEILFHSQKAQTASWLSSAVSTAGPGGIIVDE